MTNKILVINPKELEEVVRNAVSSAIKSSYPKEKIRPAQKDILNITEAGEFLHLTKATLYCLTSKKKIPHFKTGKRLYFKRSELLSWIEAGKQ